MKPSIFLQSLSFAAALLIGQASYSQVPQHLNHQGRVSVNGVNFNGTGLFKFALVVPGADANQPASGSPFWHDGVIDGVTLIPGSGYAPPPAAPPAVTFSGNGTGAMGTAIVAPDGSIASITIDNGGSGYTSATLTIEPPPPNIQYFTGWSNDQTSMSGSEPNAAIALPVTNGLYSVKLGDTTAGMEVLNPGVFSTGNHLRVWFSDGTNGFQQLKPDQPLGTAPYAFHAVQADTLLSQVTSDMIRDGAVGAAQLANGAVGPTKLADNAVSGAKIADGGIGPAKLATGAVTTAALADGAVDANKLADNAVSAAKIADGSIGSAELAAGSVIPALLAPGAAAANLNAGGNQNVNLGSGDFDSLLVGGNVNVLGKVTMYDEVNVDDKLNVFGAVNIYDNFHISGTIDSDSGIYATYLFSETDILAYGSIRSRGNVMVEGDVTTLGFVRAGSITYYGTITDISDARLKDLGEPFSAGLDTVARIEPLHYRFKQGNPLGISSDATHVGVSAQALQVALPEAVVPRDDGYLGVNQEPVVWALVNAVKELKAENEALRTRVESLEAAHP